MDQEATLPTPQHTHAHAETKMAAFPAHAQKFAFSPKFADSLEVASQPRKGSEGVKLYSTLIDGKVPVVEMPRAFMPALPSSYNGNGKYSILCNVSYTDTEACEFFRGIQEYVDRVVKANAKSWGITRKPTVMQIMRSNDEYMNYSLNFRLPTDRATGFYTGHVQLLDESSLPSTCPANFPRMLDTAVLLEVGPIWVSGSKSGLILTARGLKQLERGRPSSSIGEDGESSDPPEPNLIQFGDEAADLPPSKKPRAE